MCVTELFCCVCLRTPGCISACSQPGSCHQQVGNGRAGSPHHWILVYFTIKHSFTQYILHTAWSSHRMKQWEAGAPAAVHWVHNALRHLSTNSLCQLAPMPLNKQEKNRNTFSLLFTPSWLIQQKSLTIILTLFASTAHKLLHCSYMVQM